MDNIVKFPSKKSDEWIIGPFSENRVVLDGRRIPRLTAIKSGDGETISLVVDGRFSGDFPINVAYQAAWLIAHALAIGAGYSHFGAESKGYPFAPQCMQIDIENTQ